MVRFLALPEAGEGRTSRRSVPLPGKRHFARMSALRSLGLSARARPRGGRSGLSGATPEDEVWHLPGRGIRPNRARLLDALGSARPFAYTFRRMFLSGVKRS